jgi:hypothetical protein
MVCFSELNGSSGEEGFRTQASRALSTPIFICNCSAKKDVVNGEVVGFRISVSRTDDFADVLRISVVMIGFTGVDSVAPRHGVVGCLCSLRFPAGGVMQSVGNTVGFMFCTLCSGMY